MLNKKRMKIKLYNYRLVYILTVIIGLSLGLLSCEEEIDEHYTQSDEALEDNLKTIIAADEDLSTFYGYLQETGYDALLSYAQAYTVWAPTNDVFSQVSADTLNNADLLYELIGNHICLYSYTSSDVDEDGILVKMLNDKYIQNTTEDGEVYFDEHKVTEGDILSNNGILHKIEGVATVKSNIWEYLESKSDEFPGLVEYITQFESIVFDPDESTVIGQNTLGEDVYDSVWVSTNTYFDEVGDLDSEEDRYTFIALSDDVYAAAYDRYKDYYYHPVEDTTISNVQNTLYHNIIFDELSDDYWGTSVSNTLGNEVMIYESSVDEDRSLSNGNILVVNNFDFEPEDVIYKSIKYELENTERRTIGDNDALTISKSYDITASGLYVNKVQLDESPNDGESNNYFEVEFSYVLSADYDVYIKFADIGASQKCKLKFEFSYTDQDGNTLTHEIESIDVNPDEEGLIQIGDTYSNPVYVNDDEDNDYIVKLKVYMDVSDAELLLYDRQVGIDYIELVPVEN
jgi:uncharacterized surface protein with fasciclin (FAS1) repeats